MPIFLLPYKRFFRVAGRASRKECVSFSLFHAVLMLGLLVLAASTNFVSGINDILSASGRFYPDPEVLAAVLGLTFVPLVSAVPGWTCLGRRLHDMNLSAKYALPLLAPYVLVVLLGLWAVTLGGTVEPKILRDLLWNWVQIASAGVVVMMVLPGTSGPNKYGKDPKAIGE